MQLEEYFGSNIPRYAILSHTWGEDEVSFADFTQNKTNAVAKKGYAKIDHTCRQALENKLLYAWVDTCCIDKSSSTELSEAINSMFQWYQDAVFCYVYLEDVSEPKFHTEFPNSRWFTRGWTLQELLAPEIVMFFDRHWTRLPMRDDLAELIAEITKIDESAICHREPFGHFCVAKRMSWASYRKTTRIEDTAYSLLGIFNITMPLLYGEGVRAFTRLQEEIIRSLDDDSILAWGLDTELHDFMGFVPSYIAGQMDEGTFRLPPLAPSPKFFEHCGRLEYAAGSNAAMALTSLGLQIQIPLVPIMLSDCQSQGFFEDGDLDHIMGYLGLLSCSPSSNATLVGIVLTESGKNADGSKRLERVDFGEVMYPSNTVVVGPRAVVLSTLENVTIVRSSASQWVRNSYWGHRQFIINASPRLQALGYQVTDGRIANLAIPWHKEETPVWDSLAKILTMPRVWSLNVVAFHFELNRPNHTASFIVFLHVKHKTTRVRPPPSGSLKEAEMHLVSNLSNASDEMIAVGRDGEILQVVTKITKKKVYGWEIMELNVDAHPRPLPISLPQSHWYWTWKKDRPETESNGSQADVHMSETENLS